MKIADTQELHADLSQALGEFWEDFTGVRPTDVRVVAGEREIAVLLGEVLSPAEQQMASSQTGRKMLQELGERIMEQARPQTPTLGRTGPGGKNDLGRSAHGCSQSKRPGLFPA